VEEKPKPIANTGKASACIKREEDKERGRQLFRLTMYRIRLRILLFSSVTFKTQTKILFSTFFAYYLLLEGTFTSLVKDKKHNEVT
jgi:hypothetical protein